MTMTRLSLGTILTACLVTVFPQASYAQQRGPLWLGIGAGFGLADAKCDECQDRDRQGSLAPFFNMGFALNNRVLVGFEGNGWTKEVEHIGLEIFNLSGTVTFYPIASRGLFVKGGIGRSSLEAKVKETVTVDVDLGTGIGLLADVAHELGVRRVSRTEPIMIELGSGIGLLAGVGYDLRVWTRGSGLRTRGGREITNSISIIVASNFYYGRPGDLAWDNEKVLGNWRHNAIDLVVGAKFEGLRRPR